VDILVEMLNNIEDPLTREFQVKEISEQFRISAKSILSRIRLNFRKTDNKIESVSFLKYEEERDLLKLLLNEKTSLKKVAQEIDSSYFLFRIYRDVYDYICRYLEQNDQISGIMNSVEDEILNNTIAELLMEECPDQDASDTLKTVILRKLEKDLTDINQMLYKGDNNQELQAQKDDIKQKIRALNSKIVRKTLY
jgi:replicative DNA helicase